MYQAGLSTEIDPRAVALMGLPVPGLRQMMPALVVPHGPPVGTMVSRFEVPTGGIYAVAYHPTGLEIAAAGFDGMVRLIDPKTGKLIKEFACRPDETESPLAAWRWLR